jgi:predicted transposase YbfD/YdcC
MNQPKLFTTLNSIAETVPPSARTQSDEQNRGREEHRHLRIWTSDAVLAPVHALGWEATTTIVEIHHFGTRKAVEYDELHWYIASFHATAEEMLKAVRLHWQVENNCHWVKDVQFKEDATPTSHHDANRTLAILRDIVMNVFRLNGFFSMKHAIEKFANLVKELYELLRT